MSSPLATRVKLRVYGTLRQYVPELPYGETATLSLSQETTIGDLMDQLGIPRAEVRTSYVNGLYRQLDYLLQTDDDLAVFPPIGGG